MRTIYLILFWSVPAVIALAVLEAGALWAIRGRYDWRAALASLADLLIRQYVVYAYLAFGPADALIGWLSAHRIATVPLTPWPAIATLFLGQELCYYWFHRCSHRFRLLWANHAVHHSPNELNLSAALRFGWTGRLIGANAFFLPLIWLGFAPRAVFVTLSLNLLYQFYLHTDWIPKLGPLEWVLNTPSHHRVHHAVNPEYRDKNFGGVLIIFDRMFGTFAAERADIPCRYGLDVPLHSYNPVWIAFHEFAALGRDMWASRSWGARCRALVGIPAA
ncbi:MAG TPA: sterol desaturase family protein [Alphaproteobacteria bacterium]|nr:sterol desaturase family protein [Alphaproteobacteria bacterium]